MIQALVKLDDLPGAKKCFKERESGCSAYNICIANALIEAYAQKGQLEKAEVLKEKARRMGAKLNVKTWEIFLDYHMKKEDVKSAVDSIANAISIGRGNGEEWIPSSKTVRRLMGHFEQTKDVDAMEGFLEILKNGGDDIGEEVFESLIRTYAVAGRKDPSMHRRLKDGEC